MIKRTLCGILSLLLVSASFCQRAVHVRATTTKKGTYKPAHVRTAPDHTQRNNYSAKDRVNPYTGQVGHKTVTH